MLKIKLLILNILYKFTYPYFTYTILPLICRKNIYVEKEKINRELLRILKLVRGYSSFRLSSTGVLILFYNRNVIKIPLGQISSDSLMKNWENYNILKKSNFNEFVQYKLKKIDNYYKMDILKSIMIDEKELDLIIDKLSIKYKKNYGASLSDELFINTPLLENRCNTKIALNYKEIFLSVPMHGDLTQNNIMKNSIGSIVLIDLDRFTFEGIKGIDKFHYNVDRESSKMGISFFKYVEYSLKLSNMDISYYYIIYRVSQEYQTSVIMPQSYYDEFVSLIHKIKELKCKL